MTEDLEFSAGANDGKGPGAKLRLMREAKSMGVEEMARQLRFTPQRLAQIENDEYAAMGSSTFARGYLRSYARALGMAESEVEEILRSFDARNLGASIRTNKPVLIYEKMASTHSHASRRLGWIGLMVALVLGGFWWHGHEKAASVDAASAAASAPAASVAAPATPAATDITPPISNTTVLQPLSVQPGATAVPNTAPGVDSNKAITPAEADKPKAEVNSVTDSDSTDAKPKLKRKKRVAPVDEGAPVSDNNQDF